MIVRIVLFGMAASDAMAAVATAVVPIIIIIIKLPDRSIDIKP
jgi:uncharacterized membrane protein YkvI